MLLNEIKAYLTKVPPEYIMASVLANQVAINKGMAPSVRYRYRLEGATAYLFASPFLDGETPLTKQVITMLKSKDFSAAHTLLNRRLSEVLPDKKNPKRAIYGQAAKLVQEAEEMEASPTLSIRLL